jgi:hypothetical protein
MITVPIVLMILALVCFFVVAANLVPASRHFNVTAAGLFLWVLAVVWTAIGSVK